MTLFDDTAGRDPGASDGEIDRALELRRQGRMRDALTCLLAVLETDDANPRARLELAAVLEASGRGSQARTVLAQLARGGDSNPRTWHRLAALLAADGRTAAATACLRRALALDPAATDAHLALAALLARQGDPTAAADCYRTLLSLAPLPAAHVGLGDALTTLGRWDEAANEYGRALAQDEDNAAARLGRARLGLLGGDLPAAWRDWEARWRAAGTERPAMPGARWDGGDCAGSTILLFAEYFLADTIQFLRFVPEVAARGARVVLAVQPQLLPLLDGMAGVERVLPMGQPVPDGLAFDLNASLLELPALLGTTLDTLPADLPYVAPPEGRHRPVQAPQSALLKVGLAWIGEHRDLQVPFADLMPLLSLPGAAFYSLQTGPRAQDTAALAHPALIRDLGPTIADFADLAARVAEMDLVIAPDSLAAHLAAALGRPTWMLLTASADPRWMAGRDDTPWYPGMRLFRQHRADDWIEPVTRVVVALERRLAALRDHRAAAALAASGPVAAQRALLAGHLAAGDLLVDYGPGDGGFTLDAAAHPSGEVRVLAIEPHRPEAEMLADAVAISGAEDLVEVVAAAAGESSGHAVVSARPRRGGRRVFPLPDWVPAPVPVAALDVLLADRPHLAECRLVVRLGEAGGEEEALRGLWEGLTLLRVAALVFEHRDGGGAAALLEESGYGLWCFPGALAAGPLVPFDGQPGIVLALAPEIEPAPSYGESGDGRSPAALQRAADEAARLAAAGAAAQRADDTNEASQLYTRALALDPANFDANANLAVLLRRFGRLDASAVCSQRALAVRGMPAVWANLGNALRDLGRFAEAEATLLHAAEAAPDDPDLLYNLALLDRARGRGREACALLERSLALKADPARQWDLGMALLKTGDFAAGFARAGHRRRPAPAPSAGAVWDGGDCAARPIQVRDEADAIDTIMLARFLPQLARRGALATVECQPDLARLLATLPGVEGVVRRGEVLPACELQVALPDLPHLLGVTAATLPRDVPYLHLPEGLAPVSPLADPRLRVGLAWSGRPAERCCPLTRLLALAAVPDVALVSLQRGPRAADLGASGGRALVEDLTPGCADLADVAARIAGLDLMVGGDTVETHLAAAMGKPVWALLPLSADWRWPDGAETTPWYPTVRLFAQSPDGSWDRALARMADTLAALAAAKAQRRP